MALPFCGSPAPYSARTRASSWDGSARPALSKSKTQRPPPRMRRRFVGPEIPVTGSQVSRRTPEVLLECNDLRDERGQLVGERGATPAERGNDLGPSVVTDRLGVPGIDADRSCEVHAVEPGNQGPELDRIEVEIGVLQVHPGVEPDADLVDWGDQVAGGCSAYAGCRHAGCEGGLLEGRAFQDLGELVFGGLTDLFDCPASGLGVQPPDRAEPAARERSVRELSPRSEVECREQARDVVLGEGRHHSRMMPVYCDPTLLSARTLPLGLLMAGPPGQDRSRLHRPSGRPGGGRRPARTAFRASSRRG